MAFGNEEGVTLIEYALLAMVTAIALVSVLSDVGTAVQGFFQSVAEAFN